MSKNFADMDGVFTNGIHCGVKKKRLDLSFIYVPNAVASAGVFTTNKFVAPSVTHTKKALRKRTLKAVIVNSGNANAGVGDLGKTHTKVMVNTTASALGLSPYEVGVSSTGIIGGPLPIEHVEAGIKKMLEKPKAKDAEATAEAILTTDTCKKMAYKEAKIGKKTIIVAGITKGSGMIAPNMATTLTYLTTNVDVSQAILQESLQEATADTYNMISVDTDTSTSDMALIFATGEYKIVQVGEELEQFKALLTDVMKDLAIQIMCDGEGATKLIEAHVSGAASKADAQKIAKSIIDSPLVKCAIHGEDPNWGRILMAVGKAGTKLNQEKVEVALGGECLFRNSEALSYNEDTVKTHLKKDTIIIEVNCNLGTGCAIAWGCDLSARYVEINTDYN